MNNEYDSAVIEQFCYVQEKLDNTMNDFIVNIFTLYDINGYGELDFNNFALFIGDLLYISVLMKRMKKEEYVQETILKYARWAGGNFPTNLFTGTVNTITYYIFTKGILYALNEYDHNPMTGNTKCTHISLLPEFMFYFNYYNEIAIRRGWTLRRRSHENQLHSQLSNQATQAQQTLPPNAVMIDGSLHINGDVVIDGDLIIGSPPPPAEPPTPEPPTPEPPTPEPPTPEPPTPEPPTPEPPTPEPPTPEPPTPEPPTPEPPTTPITRQNMSPAALAAIARANGSILVQNISSNPPPPPPPMSPPAPPPPRRFIRVQPHGVQETLHEQTARSVEYLSPPLDETPPPAPPLPSFSLSQPIPVEEQVLHPTIDQGFDLDDIAPALKIDATLADAGIIDICNNEFGFDVIDGDINIFNYINENKEDHLAFKIRNSYYLSKKSQIMKMINKGQAGNSVFYGCSCVILGDWTQGSTWALLDIAADYSESYFNCHHIGLPLRYVRLNDIATILGGTDNYFLIEEPLYPKQIPSFVSDNIITHGLGSSSGVHCQSGQEDFIYEIKRFTINVVDDNVEMVEEPNK